MADKDDGRNRKRSHRVAALLVISITILALLFLFTDTEKVLDLLLNADPRIVVLIIGLYLIGLATKSYRWKVVCSSAGENVSFRKIFPLFTIGMFINNVTPGRIAGEPLRAYLLHKGHEVRGGKAVSTVFVEKLLDLTILCIISFIGVVFLVLDENTELDSGTRTTMLVFILLVAVGIASLLYISRKKHLLEVVVVRTVGTFYRFTKLSIAKKAQDNMLDLVDHFHDGVESVVKGKGGGTAMGLTGLIWLNESLRLWLVLLALGTDTFFGAVLFAACIASLFGIPLPIGAGNAAIITTVFFILGMDIELASTASLLMIMTSIWISVPIGLAFMVQLGVKFNGRKVMPESS